MGTPREDITLYGDAADRFRQLHDRLEDDMGTDLSRRQVVEVLMAEYPADNALSTA